MDPLHPGGGDLVSSEPPGHVTILRHQLSAAELVMMNLKRTKVESTRIHVQFLF